MPNVCYFTGKKTRFGNQITHRGKAKYLGGVGTKITGITARTFKPNLQTVRAVIDGRVQRVKVSTKAIKMGLVTKPPHRSWGKKARGTASVVNQECPIPGVLLPPFGRAEAGDIQGVQTTLRKSRPQPVGVSVSLNTTDRGRRLTFQLFRDIIGRRRAVTQTPGADVSRKTHAFASSKTTNYDIAYPRLRSDDTHMLDGFIVRDGVVKVVEKVPTEQELASVEQLRTAYVLLQPGHESASLDTAASLVKVMRRLLPNALYPVVIGPIDEQNLPLADQAYYLSVRVTHREYDEYMKNEGRLRGLASRLR